MMLMTLRNRGYRANTQGRRRFVQTCARMAAMLAVSSTLVACANGPKTMYDWKSYQPTVYLYLSDESGDYVKQAQALENNLETSRSANTVLPPGFRAHLGMLYLKMGQEAKGVEQLEGEKLAFPESTAFMTFLMRKVAIAPATSSTNTRTDTPTTTSLNSTVVVEDKPSTQTDID